MSYEEHLTGNARLVILRALGQQSDGRLNETMLVHELDRFGHRRSRNWVRTQLVALRELGAVTITEAGSVMVAAITGLGVAHIERRETIEGVERPSLGS